MNEREQLFLPTATRDRPRATARRPTTQRTNAFANLVSPSPPAPYCPTMPKKTGDSDCVGINSKGSSFSNPLDLLAGLASGHKRDAAESRDGSASAASSPSGQKEAAPAARVVKATAKEAPTNTPAPVPSPEKEKKRKRKLTLPVKPVGAKVADGFSVILSAVSDVPAASSQNFVINNNDVLSGRGGMTNHHPGNILFRNIVKAKQAEYICASRHEKAYIARDIVGIMRKLTPPSRFLKKDPKDPGKWVEIGDKRAREKAAQALREGTSKIRPKPTCRSSVPDSVAQQNVMAIGATPLYM